jgi:hypothetical protein
MLEAVAVRLEGGRPGSRFPLLQLLRREGPISSPECGALVFEVARLRVLLSTLPLDGADASASPPRANGNGAPRSLADVFGKPLSVVDHFARLGAASGDGTRVESAAADPSDSAPLAPVPSPAPGLAS